MNFFIWFIIPICSLFYLITSWLSQAGHASWATFASSCQWYLEGVVFRLLWFTAVFSSTKLKKILENGNYDQIPILAHLGSRGIVWKAIADSGASGRKGQCRCGQRPDNEVILDIHLQFKKRSLKAFYGREKEAGFWALGDFVFWRGKH